MKYLVVVDMQNDFIDGALGSCEAVAIVENVKKYAEEFDGEIIFTRDTHFENYSETQEGKKLPVPHCIKGSHGWEICGSLKGLSEDKIVFDKITFGSKELGKYLSEKKDIEEIVLVGLCTDICVISNAFVIKAELPEVTVKVKADCCAGVTVESHNRALEAMKMCQIEII